MPGIPGEVRDRRVTGPLELHGDWKDKRLNFVNVLFEGTVNFSGLQARSIGFYRCSFREGLDLSGSIIGGDLTAYKTAFHLAAGNAKPGLRLDGARVSGELRILGCTAEGGIFAQNARIAGDADFRGVRAYGRGGAPAAAELQNLGDRSEFLDTFGAHYPHLEPAFKLTGTLIEGSLLVSALYDERMRGVIDYARFPRLPFFGGGVEFANIEIAGDLDLHGFVATQDLSLQNSIVKGSIKARPQAPGGRLVRCMVGGKVDLYGVKVGGNLEFNSALIGRGMSVRFGQVDGYLFAKSTGESTFPPLELGKDEENLSLDFSGSKFGGVECAGAKMDGRVQAITGNFGRFYLTPLDKSREVEKPDITLCEAAGLVMRSVTISENARFHAIQLRSTAEHAETELGFKDTFLMINCSVGGELSIGSDGLGRHLRPGLPYKGRLVPPQGIGASFAAASGTGQPAQHPGESWADFDAGYPTRLESLNLSGTKVDRDLSLSCLIAAEDLRLDHVTVKGDVRMSRASPHYGNAKPLDDYRTKCADLWATGLECSGDLSLDGLQATGSVTARHLKVRGDLLLAAENDPKVCAEIAEDADFQGASASVFVFSGYNFHGDTTAKSTLRLADTKGKGTLTLADTEFRKIAVKAASQLPDRDRMLICNNASVLRWEFDADEKEKPTFHRKTSPALGGVYVSIEKYFREQGQFHQANRVLRDRERRFGWGIGQSIGYGTNYWLPLIAILLVIAGLILIFWNPTNVDAGPALRAQLANVEAGEIHPGDGRCAKYCSENRDCKQICGAWTVWDTVFMAGRYSVPLAGNAVDDTWRPSLKISTLVRVLSFLSSWILWPAFLYVFVRRALRKL